MDSRAFGSIFSIVLKASSWGPYSRSGLTAASCFRNDTTDFLTKVEAENEEENLKNLSQDKVQFIAIDRHVAKNILVNKSPWQLGEVNFIGPPLEKKPHLMIFSRQAKDHKQMIEAFNAGLALVKTDGLLKEIMRKYGFYSRPVSRRFSPLNAVRAAALKALHSASNWIQLPYRRNIRCLK